MFNNSNQTVVIKNVRKLDISQASQEQRVAAILCSSYVGSSRQGEAQISDAEYSVDHRLYGGSLARPPKEGNDELQDPEELAGCDIKSKFLAAQVNQQAALSRSQAKSRVVYVEKPKSANENESDVMSKNLHEGKMPTYKQLSHVNNEDRQAVADYLPGCSSSRDSQYKVGSRLEGGLVSRGCAAASAPLPAASHDGAGIGSPISPSVSSFRPTSKHSALVELCCGPKSLIGGEAALRGLSVLRVTRDTHDLTSQAGRSAVAKDLRQILGKHKVHLWASLPCRPWSQLAELNKRKLGPKFRAYLEVQREESLGLVEVFLGRAELVIASGGTVSFEWPAHCVGWHIPA